VEKSAQEQVTEIRLSKMLWCDLKTNDQRSKWLLLGRGYETGVVAKAIQNDLAMAYHKLALIEQQAQQQEPVAIVEAVVPHLESIVVKHILDAPFPRVGDFFYTSPPANANAGKPWVGLTDEELEIINDCGDTDSYKFARAIEAKLREKNT